MAGLSLAAAVGAQLRLPAGREVVELRAVEQRVEGPVFHAVGDVEVRFGALRMYADRLSYHTETGEATASGNVRFELESQRIQAGEARYNFRSGRGLFRGVRGSIHIQREPNPNILMTDNPLLFEAEEVERVDARTIRIRGAWVTVCPPDQPLWRFYAPRAEIRLEDKVVLHHANFRLLHVPVIYMPYATAPAARRQRQSGFLLPHFANSSSKGFVFGDSFYWAPAEWMDVTLGAELLSRRGYSQLGEIRVRPWEGARLDASFFAVNDRGLIGASGVREPADGHEFRVQMVTPFPGGWRVAADINQLTSLRFRLAFAETFQAASNPEIRSSVFASNNFRGFSLNFGAINYKNFLSADPETAVILRSAPGARLSSVEQAPWARLPVYFGFHVFADAVHRDEPGFETPDAVQRTEVAPRVTIPLRWGPWLGVTNSFTVRTTHYGSRLVAGTVVNDPLRRTTTELTTDLRPPSLARVWEGGAMSWKHVVEPRVVYRRVDGVNQFGRFLRFDESDTLTDTNELEYSVTQRLFRRQREGHAEELLTLRVAQKYYFDPTFGGAIVPGRRNVFQALNSLTAFAFADGRRRFSPMVSDVRLMPGGIYDAQVRIDFDTENRRVSAIGTLLNMKPYRESFVTLAHFATRGNPALQPRSNQLRALFGWGEIYRRGINGSFALSYDYRQKFFQNQVAQVSWNGSCCGIAVEFRRLALGPLRSENQFRIALLVANIGTFGNLRRAEKIF
jgi:LPS-assembly protein